MHVSGKVQSSVPVHSVVVAEASRNPRADYWTKTFVSKVSPDGTFKVTVSDLEDRDGCLKIMFCGKNGAVLGEKEGRGFDGGFSLPYRHQDGAFVFAPGSQTEAD